MRSISRRRVRTTAGRWQHGINYSGLKIPEAKGEHVEGTEKPLFVWKVSPAVSGMAFYNSDVFPQWKNKLFIGALKEKDVIVRRRGG